MDLNADHPRGETAIAEEIDCHDGLPDSAPSSSYAMLSLVCRRLQTNWKVIALGQGLSFLLASAGAAQATLHLSCGLSAPTFTMALVYLGLSMIHLPIFFWRTRHKTICCSSLCQRVEAERLSTHDPDTRFGEERAESSDENDRSTALNSSDAAMDVTATKTFSWSLWWYLLLAFFDVEANAVTMLAFRYTTLTSVTLFDALAIPAAMIISRYIVFRSSRRYHSLHYVGVLVCMVGVVLNVFQDYESDQENDEAEYPHKLWGDLCAITGGILYGLNDVLTEVTVSKIGGTTEYLGMLGVFGFLLSFLQSLLFEREEIRMFFPSNGGFDTGNGSNSTCSLQSGLLLLSAFVGVTICSYVGGSHFLRISEAAFFNLSLLTGDLWSVLFSVVEERIIPRPLFFSALAAVLSGVVIYEMAPSPMLEKEQEHLQQHREMCNNGTHGNEEKLEHGGCGGMQDGFVVGNHRLLHTESRSEPPEPLNHDDTAFSGVELKGKVIT